jgi:2-polyprenyl-3-methyl-5-hydroxy-6-metoxy-1,4-benzoquinol methylase
MNWRNGKLAIAKAIHLDLTHNLVRYGHALRQYVRPGDRWLDVGCGYQILPFWAMPQAEQAQIVHSAAFLVGVDVDERIATHPLLSYRVKALGGALPFKDGTFDLVTANMVVEHVEDPESFMADVHRVLRPGGRFLFHTPNYLYWLVFLASITPEAVKKPIIQALEGRTADDVFPTHYRINTANRITCLAKQSGFAVEELSVIGSSGSFGRLGPIGWAECFLLKGLEVGFKGRFNQNIIACLRREPSANRQ